VERRRRRRIASLIFSSQPKTDLFFPPCDDKLWANCALVSNSRQKRIIGDCLPCCGAVAGRRSGNESCPASFISRDTKRKEEKTSPSNCNRASVTSSRIYRTVRRIYTVCLMVSVPTVCCSPPPSLPVPYYLVVV
jgi:hypothetical protein